MKKIITLFAFLLIGFGFAQVPSYVPSNGLVGWWPFNGNANDESGNGNHGTVNGAALTTDRVGNSNSAFSFDGNDYISLKDAFFNGSVNVTAMSYSIWFFSNSLPTNTFDLSTKEGFWRSFTLGINNTGLVQFSSSQPSPQGYFNILTSNPFVQNQWNHVVVTYSNSELKIYLNGLLSNSKTIIYPSLNYSYLASGNSTSTNTIGASIPLTPGIVNFMRGKIDDFGIWNRALTASEVQQLYSGQLSITETSKSLDIKYYPNPVENSLALSSEEAISKVSIYDTAGQLVLAKECNSKSVSLDISKLIAGSYFVKVEGKSKTNEFKIIKK